MSEIMEMKRELANALLHLQTAAIQLEDAKAELKVFLDASQEYNVLKDRVSNEIGKKAKAEEIVRGLAVELSEELGSKSLLGGTIIVKTFRSTSYRWGDITKWAKENSPIMLTVDQKAFKAWAKNTTQIPTLNGIPLYEENETLKATISWSKLPAFISRYAQDGIPDEE